MATTYEVLERRQTFINNLSAKTNNRLTEAEIQKIAED
jgi:hypothetical protein